MAFHADGASRSIKTTGDLGTIDVNVDMRSAAILGNGSQRAAAIDNYLKQFDKASSRGRADPALMAMFKDAFIQLNTIQDGGASALLKTPPRIPLSANDHAMLTGLADFRASVTQATSAPNPMRADEKDGFSYQVSQETQIGGRDPSSRTMSQRQHSHLTASFHAALSADLSLMLTDDPKSQNYHYTQIDDNTGLAGIAEAVRGRGKGVHSATADRMGTDAVVDSRRHRAAIRSIRNRRAHGRDAVT
ncbi:hypothetical protein [Luteibacter yeojuensis]